MATSANERFHHIFANKSRPPKPDSQTVTTSHPTTPKDHHGIQAYNADTCAATTSSTLNIPNSSDDDDDYAAAFIKKPKMKEEQSKDSNQPHTAAVARQTNIGLHASPAFIPQGKSRETAIFDHFKESIIADSSSEQPLSGQFCSFQLAARFPYKYMNDPDDRVSRQFFADNKFYSRTWDLHYLHPPKSFAKSALILVPLGQMQQLVDQIASAFEIEVEVPSFPFTIHFYDDGTPQPVFLGTSTNRERATDLIDQVPEADLGHGECPPEASADIAKAYEVFHDKIEAALLAIKGKHKNSAQKKTSKLFHALAESRGQLKRAQRYFGLRPRTRPVEPAQTLSWADEQAYQKSQQRPCGLLFDFLDVGQLVKHSFENSAIVIAIDVESYERNHGFITEIGISTLDTLDLVDLPPGPTGAEWVKQIRSRHFRIKGREHMINRDFCTGNPDAFQFGTSEFVTLSNASDAVDSCFEWPFSVLSKKAGPTPPDQSSTPESDSSDIDPKTIQKGPNMRNIVLLGHDVGTDLEYLQNLGSEIFNPHLSKAVQRGNISKTNRHLILSRVLETLDTATMYMTFASEQQHRSLSHICTKLGIDPWFSHNAGNDARYTLEALVKMLIQARLSEDEDQRARDPESEGMLENEWEAEKMRHVDERVESARQKVESKIMNQSSGLATALSPDSPEELPANNNPGKDGDILDWSLPLRNKKQQKYSQLPKAPELTMEERIRRFHEVEGVVASGGAWETGSEVQPESPW